MTAALDALTWLHGLLGALAGVAGVALGWIAAMARHRRLLATIGAGIDAVRETGDAERRGVIDEGARQVRRIRRAADAPD